MARPKKDGLEYFSHDVHAANDKKVEALRMLYGNDGYAFFFILLETIYQEANFELDISDAETIQILCRKTELTFERFNMILETAIKRECFDRDAYEERGVLTSNGIKKRAEVVVKKRVKMQESYREKVSAAETLPETRQNGVVSAPKVKESESKGNKKTSCPKPKKVYDEESPPYKLADYLFKRILSVNPDINRPDIQKWADTMRKIVELDKHDLHEVSRVIKWASSDTFWQGVMLSPESLRRNWNKITMQMKKENEPRYKPNNKLIQLPVTQSTEEERAHVAEMARRQAERNGVSISNGG